MSTFYNYPGIFKARPASSTASLTSLTNKEVIIDEKGATGVELAFKDTTGTLAAIATTSTLGSIASGKGAELIGLSISGLTGTNVKTVLGSIKTILDSNNTTVSGLSTSIDSLNTTVSGISTSIGSLTPTSVGLSNVTNDAQLKASQLEQTVSNSSSMIPSSAAIASAISTASTNAINTAVSTAVTNATSSITKASLGLDQVSNVAQLPASALVQTVSTSTSEVPSASAIKTYVESKIDSSLSGLNWQDDVINVQIDALNPAVGYNTPAIGDRWIITDRQTCSEYFGEFLETIHDGDIVKYVGPISGYPGSWFSLAFDSTAANAAGALVWVKDLGVFYRFDGTIWNEFSGMDSVTAGDAVNKSGNTISVKYDNTTITTNVDGFLTLNTSVAAPEDLLQTLVLKPDGSIGYTSMMIDINTQTMGTLNAERGGVGFDASPLYNSANYGKLMMIQEPTAGNNYTWIVPADINPDPGNLV